VSRVVSDVGLTGIKVHGKFAHSAHVLMAPRYGGRPNDPGSESSNLGRDLLFL
jgi:hypothetical protein